MFDLELETYVAWVVATDDENESVLYACPSKEYAENECKEYNKLLNSVIDRDVPKRKVKQIEFVDSVQPRNSLEQFNKGFYQKVS